MSTTTKAAVAYHATAEVTVIIEIKDPDVIERVTGPNGDEWRRHAYDLRTQEEVLQHLYYNAVANGVEQVNRLDGWADLPDDACRMTIRGAQDINWLDIAAIKM